MKDYTFSETLEFRVNQINNAVSKKQAQFFYYKKFKNLLIWNPDLSEAEIQAFNKANLDLQSKLFGDSPKKSYPKTSTKQPRVASAETSKYSPEVSKNGRSNNQAKLDAMIATLKSSAEGILHAIEIADTIK